MTTETTETAEGKGTFVQNVTVSFPVRIDAGANDFNKITVADLQAATERYIAERLGDMAEQAGEISAQRGPTGYRYFFPGTDVETDVALPFRVALSDLMKDR